MRVILGIILTGVCSTLIMTPAIAGSCSSTGCTANVKEVYLNNNGPLYIILNLTSTDIAAVNCTLLAGTIFELSTSTNNYKEIYSTISAAAFTGRPVTLRIDDGTNPCTIQYAKVDF
jgi:hypothetical protein